MNEVEIEHAQASRKILSYSWEAGTQCSILVEEGNKPPFFFFSECAEYVSFPSIWLLGFLGNIISAISTLRRK